MRVIVALIALWIMGAVSTHAAENPNAYGQVAEVGEGKVKAWLIEAHSAPIIAVQLAVKHAGSSYDPKGKEGLAVMVAQMMDKGAGDMDALTFRKKLESLAISLNIAADDDTLFITMKTLAEHKEEAFELLKLVLSKPRFDDDIVREVKDYMRVKLAQNKEDPATIAMEHWRSAYFGDHPYGRPREGTEKSVAAVTRKDIEAYFREHMTQDQLVVSVVGDITRADLSLLLEELTSSLPETDKVTFNLTDFTETPKGNVTLIDKPIPQAVAIFGHQGIKRHDPDFYNAYVLNYIVGGGGFESRLMNEVREKRGLAYSVYSYLDMLEYAPAFQGIVATQNSKIGESLAVIKEQLTRIKAGDISEEELEHAKRYLILSFPIKLDKNESLAGFLTRMQLDSLGIDFLQKRASYIERVTLSDVKRVAAKLLNPDMLVTIVVGNRKDITLQ